MHVVLVTGEFIGEANAHGGLAAATERSARALAALGYFVTVAVCSDRNTHEKHDGYHILRINTTRPRWANVSSFCTAHRLAVIIDSWSMGIAVKKALINLHRKQPISVVQYPNLGGLACWAPRLPLVVRISCHRRSWHQAGDHALNSWHANLLHRLEIRSLSTAEIAFAPSRHVAEYCAHDAGRRILTIPTIAIDAPVQESTKSRPQTSPELLIIGSRSPLKGVDLITALLPHLLVDYPELHLTWIGATVDRISDDCLRIAAGPLNHRLTIVEPRPRHEVQLAMRRCRILVIPSLIDNLPNVLIEGLSVGAIVVANSHTGADQLIVDGISGILSRGNDPTSLRAAIDRAWNLTSHQRCHMAQAAQATVAPRQGNLRALLACYRTAIRRHHRARK